jgi:hypothetical protein
MTQQQRDTSTVASREPPVSLQDWLRMTSHRYEEDINRRIENKRTQMSNTVQQIQGWLDQATTEEERQAYTKLLQTANARDQSDLVRLEQEKQKSEQHLTEIYNSYMKS